MKKTKDSSAARTHWMIRVLKVVPFILLGIALTFLGIAIKERIEYILHLEDTVSILTAENNELAANRNLMIWQMDKSCYDQINDGDKNVSIYLMK